MNLFEMNQQYLATFAEAERIAEENAGVIPDDLGAKLDAIDSDRTAKIENIIKFIKNEEALADMLEAEKKAFAERQAAHDNRATWLRRYLVSVIGEGTKIELPCGRISWREAPSVEIVNDFGIPEECYKTERTLLKSEVKKLIEAGKIDDKTAKIVRHKSMQLK